MEQAGVKSDKWRDLVLNDRHLLHRLRTIVCSSDLLPYNPDFNPISNSILIRLCLNTDDLSMFKMPMNCSSMSESYNKIGSPDNWFQWLPLILSPGRSVKAADQREVFCSVFSHLAS